MHVILQATQPTLMPIVKSTNHWDLMFMNVVNANQVIVSQHLQEQKKFVPKKLLIVQFTIQMVLVQNVMVE